MVEAEDNQQNPPPTGTPPTNQPPTNPPLTDPPPSAYQIPALNTNFSDEGYFFFDDFTGFTFGVTSDGVDVAIIIIDSTGTSIGAIAFPLDAFACIIDIGVIGEAAFMLEAYAADQMTIHCFLLLISLLKTLNSLILL